MDDSILKLLDRPVLAYRSRKLFDTAEAKLTTLTAMKTTGEVFALQSKPKPAPAVGVDWSLTKPIAFATDAAKADGFIAGWTNLEATEIRR